MRIINVTRGTVLAEQGETARSFWARLKGLLLTETLQGGQGLLIKPCNSIHTIGMSYSIDALFVNSQDIVIKVAANIKPYRAVACTHSAYVIELPAGILAGTGTQIGDKVEFVD